MENRILKRKELYDLVWSKPLSQISKTYEINTTSIKTICANYNIPLPKIGYWMKLEYGKEVEIIPLTTNEELDNQFN